jgi:hypothetical protein
MSDLLAPRRRRVNFQPSPLLKSEGFWFFQKLINKQNKEKITPAVSLTKFGKTERIVV